MADEQEQKVPASTYSMKVIDAMVEALKAATSPEMMEAQTILMRRLALSGDLVPSRVPAPQNITEIGGYLNLLETLQQSDLRAQVLASVLGVAGPNPPAGWFPTGPVLFFAARTNDRPAGAGQAAIPVQYSVRSDFAPALDAAVQDIHDRGCQLPQLSPVRTLPPADASSQPPTDLLRFLGRILDLVPSAALNDPDQDPLALARPTAGGALGVVARQLDTTAPNAGSVPQGDWTAWQCTATTCQETQSATRVYLPLAPILNGAGWYQPVPGVPTSLSTPGNWARWTNTTGLVAWLTLFGDELRLLYSDAQIAASSLRERLLWVWNGADFVQV